MLQLKSNLGVIPLQKFKTLIFVDTFYSMNDLLGGSKVLFCLT